MRDNVCLCSWVVLQTTMSKGRGGLLVCHHVEPAWQHVMAGTSCTGRLLPSQKTHNLPTTQVASKVHVTATRVAFGAYLHLGGYSGLCNVVLQCLLCSVLSLLAVSAVLAAGTDAAGALTAVIASWEYSGC